MNKKPHDSFAKKYLEELLSPLGRVEISREIVDEARQVDVFFSPKSFDSDYTQSLGLMGQLFRLTSLIEVFRNPPKKAEMRKCMIKLFIYCAEQEREARRDNSPISEENLAWLWILTPSASNDFLKSFGATLDIERGVAGVFSFPEGWRGSIVAINQLPVINETLWLRILGKGEVQHQAVNQLLALPDTNELKESTLKLIANWRIITINQPNLTEEDQEIVMNLSTAYLEWEQKTLEQGKQLQTQQIVKRQLNRRVGEIDASLLKQVEALPIEVLEALTEALLDFSTVADLEQWLKIKH